MANSTMELAETLSKLPAEIATLLACSMLGAVMGFDLGVNFDKAKSEGTKEATACNT